MPSIKTVLRHSEVVDLCHLHTCKLIAPVPCTCGWCEGRRAASPPKLQPCWCGRGCWPTRVAGARCRHRELCPGSLRRSQPDGSRLGRAGSSPGSYRALGGRGGAGGRGLLLQLPPGPAACLSNPVLVRQCPWDSLVLLCFGRQESSSGCCNRAAETGILTTAPAGWVAYAGQAHSKLAQPLRWAKTFQGVADSNYCRAGRAW